MSANKLLGHVIALLLLAGGAAAQDAAPPSPTLPSALTAPQGPSPVRPIPAPPPSTAVPPASSPPISPAVTPPASMVAPAERNRILELQRDTFLFNVEADRAAALEKWCKTAYGDPLLCAGGRTAVNAIVQAPSAAPPAAATRQPEAAERPTVAEITGFGNNLAAVLAYGDGRRLRVVPPRDGKPGSVLPDGAEVVGISSGEVQVKPKGGPAVALVFSTPLFPADSSTPLNR